MSSHFTVINDHSPFHPEEQEAAPGKAAAARFMDGESNGGKAGG